MGVLEKMLHTIVEKMETEKVIEAEQKDYYLYSMTILVEKWITVITLLLMSLIFKRFVHTIVFLTSFFALRKRTGGFHAGKFWQCYLGTVFTYVVIVLSEALFVQHRNVMYVAAFFATVVIAVIGTVNHPNMDMNSLELEESKNGARYVLALECMILCLLIIFNFDIVYICYMVIAIILCATLLCIAKLLRQEV